MLTKNEKLLIADTLNGCGMLLEADPTWLGLMVGDDGALADAQILCPDAWDRITMTGRVCSGLEHEVYDAIRLNQLDQKWEIDGRALVNKIAALTPAEREQIIRTVAAVWSRNDERFEADLEALAV